MANSACLVGRGDYCLATGSTGRAGEGANRLGQSRAMRAAHRAVVIHPQDTPVNSTR